MDKFKHLILPTIRTTLLCAVVLICRGARADETPPFSQDDPAASESSRSGSLILYGHIHDGTDSAFLRTILPETDSAWNIGAVGREWSTGYFDSIVTTTFSATLATINRIISSNIDLNQVAYNNGANLVGSPSLTFGGTTLSAPIVAASTFSFAQETIGFSGMKWRPSDGMTCLDNRSVDGVCFNGSGQAISTISGTAAIPQYSFLADGGTGFYLAAVADVLGVSAGTMKAMQISQSTTSDSQSRSPMTLYNGGLAGANANTPAGSADFRMQTTISLSSTTATKILDITTEGAIVIVSGNDGTNYFCDLLITGFLATTPTAISSKTISGSPPARTYTNAASGEDLKLQMASGTGMKCSSLAIQLRSR